MAEGNGVFARIRQDHKLVRKIAANGAGIGLHRAKAQTQALEQAGVGPVHGPVACLRARVCGVKRIAVLHDELAPAHETEAGADFITKLGLDLIQTHGQLPVGAHFAAHQVRDHFLMGGARQ